MTTLLEFLANSAPYLYGLCILIALYLLRSAFVSRRERRSALFPLEREVALGRTYRTLGAALVLIAVIAALWAATERLLPQLEQVELAIAPTPDILVLIDTPTPTPPPPTVTPTITPTAPTPTRVPTRAITLPTATPIPVVVRSPSCANPAAAITSPGVGQIIPGTVAIIGTANIDDFQFYKLEWQSNANPGVWNWFAGTEQSVVNGTLGLFNPSGLPAGSYIIRLIVVDLTGNYPEPCSVQVIVP